jgi:maleylacetoacetate isomerase
MVLRIPLDSNSLVPKLYTYFLSTASFRVRILLNLKQLTYSKKFVNISKGDH